MRKTETFLFRSPGSTVWRTFELTSVGGDIPLVAVIDGQKMPLAEAQKLLEGCELSEP